MFKKIPHSQIPYFVRAHVNIIGARPIHSGYFDFRKIHFHYVLSIYTNGKYIVEITFIDSAHHFCSYKFWLVGKRYFGYIQFRNIPFFMRFAYSFYIHSTNC